MWSGPAQREAPWFVGFQSTLSFWLLRGSHPRGWARGGSPRKWSPEAAGEQAQGPPTGHRGNRLDQADIWTVRGTRSPWAGSSAELGVGGDPGRRGSKLVPARGALPVQWGRSAQVWPQPPGALVGVSRASPSWVSRGDTVDRGHLAPVRGAGRTEAGRECTQDLGSHGAVDGSLPPGHQPAPAQEVALCGAFKGGHIPGAWEPRSSLGSRPCRVTPTAGEASVWPRLLRVLWTDRQVWTGRRPEPVFVAPCSSWGQGSAAEGCGPRSLRGLGLGENLHESRRCRPVPGQQASGRACTGRRGHSRAWRGPPGVSQGGGGDTRQQVPLPRRQGGLGEGKPEDAGRRGPGGPQALRLLLPSLEPPAPWPLRDREGPGVDPQDPRDPRLLGLRLPHTSGESGGSSGGTCASPVAFSQRTKARSSLPVPCTCACVRAVTVPGRNPVTG